MNRAWVMSFVVLASGCCFMPSAAPAPAPAPAAGGPGTAGCPDLATSILGTWTREGFVEEYRADGTYVINGQTGTIRWLSPGHALLDVPSGGLHVEYDLALADAATLVAADPNHIGTVYLRTSPPPSIPASCFELSGAWIGDWVPIAGGASEHYDADGTYAAPGHGHWSFGTPGRLHLVNDNGIVSDYVVGMATPTTAIAVSLPPLAPAGTAYRRGP